MTSNSAREPASFRDPSGFLYREDGELYRQVNRGYQEHYDMLQESGLYDELVRDELLIPHEEVDRPGAAPEAYVVLRPEEVEFISYPYEWCFGELKEAAGLTLRVQRRAMEHGMTLKDASAYNVQFRGGRPILIDTLSFERLEEGEPWVAYRQFCQHFLAPLALMAHRDVRLGGLLREHIDGVPLQLAKELLPRRTMLNFSLLFHLHLHASAERRFAGRDVSEESKRTGGMGQRSLEGIIDDLSRAVQGLTWEPGGTPWADYYSFHGYGERALAAKEGLVADFIERAQPGTCWDLGANTGRFSRLASERGAYTVAFDVDPAAVERAYQMARENQERNLLPLVMDLTNPSPALGWGHRERKSLQERGPVDLVMALALVHHLAIGNNVPLNLIVDFFAELGAWLLVEFVPKGDSQVQRLLASRADIFENYDLASFKEACGRHYEIVQEAGIPETDRTLFLLKRRAG